MVGAQERLDEVFFDTAGSVIFGLRTDGDFEGPELNPLDDLLLQPGTQEDIFFSETLGFSEIQDRAVILVPLETELTFDLEDQYFGLNVTNPITFDTAAFIDLFGQVGDLRSRAAGLAGDHGPADGHAGIQQLPRRRPE